MHALEPIEAVMFDHDGTLVNSLATVVSASNGVLLERGLPAASWNQIVAGMVHPTARRLGILAKDERVVEQEQMAQRYSQLALQDSVLASLYPGIQEALDVLSRKRLRLGVVSNSRGTFIRDILRRLGVAQHFISMIGEDDMPAPKPDPRGLLAALGTVPRERAVYVGDSSVDLDTARKAGIRAIGVTWGTHPKAELEPLGFDALADTPNELVSHLLA